MMPAQPGDKVVTPVDLFAANPKSAVTERVGGSDFATALQGRMAQQAADAAGERATVDGGTGLVREQPEAAIETAAGESTAAGLIFGPRDRAAADFELLDDLEEGNEAAAGEGGPVGGDADPDDGEQLPEEATAAATDGKNLPQGMPFPLTGGIGAVRPAMGEGSPDALRRVAQGDVPLRQESREQRAGQGNPDNGRMDGDRFAHRLLSGLERGDRFAAAMAVERRPLAVAELHSQLKALQEAAGRPTTPAQGAPAPGALLSTQGGQPPPAALPTMTLTTPLQQQGWGSELGERVIWMARQGQQQAQIQLNPRELGPIQVRVAVTQDQASVTFTAQNPVTREALEAALPRLREMMQESGLNLAESNVSRDGGEGHSAAGKGEGGHLSGASRGAAGAPFSEQSEAPETHYRGTGVVDYFV